MYIKYEQNDDCPQQQQQQLQQQQEQQQTQPKQQQQIQQLSSFCLEYLKILESGKRGKLWKIWNFDVTDRLNLRCKSSDFCFKMQCDVMFCCVYLSFIREYLC